MGRRKELIDNGLLVLRNRVRHIRPGIMALPWTVPAFEAISETCRRFMGHADFWMLTPAMDENGKDWFLADQANTAFH